MYQIRQAQWADFDRILEIYAIARDFMAQTGNPTQWGNHYPPLSMLEADIPAGNLYVVEDQGIHGVFAYFSEPDPTYAYIEDGAWLSDRPLLQRWPAPPADRGPSAPSASAHP